MKNFYLNLSARVEFGYNILEQCLKKNKSLIGAKPLILSTSFLENSYIKDVLRQCLEDYIIEYVTANPKDYEINAMIGRYKHQKITSVLGIGGGSAIDAAKAVAMLLNTGLNSVHEAFNIKNYHAVIPIIAIPTTAGTGSELSKGAIINLSDTKEKVGLRAEENIPRLAIVDYKTTETLPLRETIETGFDALAHSIESYISLNANPFTEMLSVEAFKIIFDALPKLSQDLSNIKLREKMSYASMIMGLNLASVGTCLPHRMQYVVGGVTDTTHAQGLAALYPGWLHYTYSTHDRFIKLQEILGLKDLQEELLNFIKKLGLNCRLSDFELGFSVKELADRVKGTLTDDPGYSENVLEKIFAYVY